MRFGTLLSFVLFSSLIQADVNFIPVCQRSVSAVEFFERWFERPCKDISTKDFESLHFLTISKLENASFKEGDFSGLTQLRLLTFDSIAILELAPRVFTGLASVDRIAFQDAGLVTLHANTFLNVEQIRSLYINSPTLKQLEPGAFNGLKNVQSIVFLQGTIEKVSRGVFRDLPELRQVDLVNLFDLNTIEDYAFADLPKLEAVTFGKIRGLSPLRSTNKAAFSGVPFVVGLPGEFDLESEEWGTP